MPIHILFFHPNQVVVERGQLEVILQLCLQWLRVELPNTLRMIFYIQKILHILIMPIRLF